MQYIHWLRMNYSTDIVNIVCQNDLPASVSLNCFDGVIDLQYVPRNMHTVFALLCFVVVIHWLIFPYPSGLLHWHCGNLTIAPVSAKQPWWIWINTSCEFIMNDCITTTKQSTTKPCAYFLGYTVVYANWGRTQPYSVACPEPRGAHQDTGCYLSIYDQFSACHGATSCVVPDVSGMGVGPCYNTAKYMQVLYFCNAGKSVN